MSAPKNPLCSFVSSSIGRKLIVAITGLAFVLFLAGHLTGNLLIFAGEDAFNEYAYFLHHFLHGAGVWVARLGLLVCLVLHVWFTILLTKENKSARPKYAHQATVQAPKSSRIMIWSGLTILAFIIYHILHFTARVGNDYNGDRYQTTLKTGEDAHNAWLMVIDGFSWWPAALFYVIAMTLLCSHLSHGLASIFQTLGLRTKKTAPLINLTAKAYTLVIFLGFISIPIAIYLFGFGCSCK